MADENMLQLPTAVSVDGSEYAWIVQAGTDKRVLLSAIANTATGFVPTSRIIATPTAGGLTGGGTLATDLTLNWAPVDLNAKTAMVVADAFAINDSSGNTPAKATFPNAMKAIAGLPALGVPSTTLDYLVITHAADGLTYKVNVSSLGLATGNLPGGGTTGQFLIKQSATDFDTAWSGSASSLALGGAAIGSNALAVTGTANISGDVTSAGQFQAGAGQGFYWAGRSVMSSPSNGVILLSNLLVNDFSRLQLGGTTSSFPAIKRNGTGIDIRLADDSAYANVTPGQVNAQGQVTSTGLIQAAVTTALPAGGAANVGFAATTANMNILFGFGVPTVPAAQGSFYLTSAGAPYYNNNGTTGWTQLLAAGSAANTALSNLASVAINTSLLFGVDGASNIGAGGATRPGAGFFSANIWSGNVTSALTTLTGANDGFRGSAANATAIAGENTTSSSASAGALVGMYSNDGAAMASGDRLGGIRMGGSSSASALRNSAGIFAFAAEGWVDASAYGSRLEFQTTTNGGTSLSTKAILSNAGLLALGATLANTVPAFKPSSTSMQVRLGDDSAFTDISSFTHTFNGSSSGAVVVTPQATAGTPTLTLPNASGTFAVSVSAPLALSATTGNLTITGVAGQVLAGATPAFTATPTLGVTGASIGTLTLAGNSSGAVTITPQAAAGTATFTLPNASGTPAISVPSPLSLSAVTGAVTWAGLTSGGVLYASGTTSVASSALLTANGVVLGGGAGTAPGVTAAGTNGQVLMGNTSSAPTFQGMSTSITFIIDGGGLAITTGIKGDLTIPFGCTITEWTLLADQSGSIVVDIWKDTYANYPPTVADTITASAKPTITTATKGQSSTLSGWTTTITAGDTLRFNVDSITTCTRVTLSLKVTRTSA